MYHVRDEGGSEYPVEFLNDQWYQLTWGASGYQMSTSSVILPNIHVCLRLGWYQPNDRQYQELLPPMGVIVSEEKGKGRSTDLHSPRSPKGEDDESKGDSPLGIQVEESPVEESPVKGPIRTGTPMPGEWKANLEERIQLAQLKHMVKISDKGVDEPLPKPRLFPKVSAIAFSEALKNIENIPPQKSPLISPTAIGALSGSAHIFQPQATFQPSFGQTSFPTMIGAATTTMTTKTRPQSAAARHPVWSGPGSGHSSGGGTSGGPGGGGGGGPGGSRGSGPGGGGGRHAAGGGRSNRGMKGNPPSIFHGDRSKSDDFLREFKIYQMANS